MNHPDLHTLISSTDTTALDTTAKVWRNNFHRFDPSEGISGYSQNSSLPSPYQYSESGESGRSCSILFADVQESTSHLDRLSHSLFSILCPPFFHGEDIEAREVCKSALSLIARLPSRGSPLRFPFNVEATDDTLHRYCHAFPPTSQVDLRDSGALDVASFVSATAIHVALMVSLVAKMGDNPGQWDHHLVANLEASAYIQTILARLASLVDSASSEIEKEEDVSKRKKWFIVKTFLWTSWQRCLLLYSWWQLRLAVCGLSGRETFILDLIRFQIPSTAGSQCSSGCENTQLPQYMCTWAFEILRSNPKTESLDYRLFADRFATHYGTFSPRCLINPYRPCSGISPYHCQRFVGARIEDQSMHDSAFCTPRKGCSKLVWDEASYRKTVGGRAVSLERTEGTHLQYTTVSKTTLVISHVWSHGQGGRPETGLNSCLHLRYSSIAKAAGCDSYWIDTACIPEDHDLRRQAIMEINHTFMLGKLTLVCDKDLMDIDISIPTVEIHELILVTLLICDWNLRAWTMLEASKGWVNIHILCKDNRIISLKHVLVSVLQHGHIDIACTFLGSTHLIPQSFCSSAYIYVSEAPKTVTLGPNRFFNIDKAGAMLSCRPASRPGDENVIWSLLCNSETEIFDLAEDLWTQGMHRWGFSTLFLISSAPRIQNRRGLGWAPARPNIPAPMENRAAAAEIYIPSLDLESEHASVMEEGLKANWFISKFRYSDALSEGEPRSQLSTVAKQYLQPHYTWGALLQASSLLAPKQLIQYTWRSSMTIVAVVASNDECSTWDWKGVYAWNHEQEPVPHSALEEVLLV